MIYCELMHGLQLLVDNIKRDIDDKTVWQLGFYAREYNNFVKRFISSSKDDGHDYAGIQLLKVDNNALENGQLLEQLCYKSELLLSRVRLLCEHHNNNIDTATIKNTDTKNVTGKNVFIIHGHSEARWRELEKILEKDFGLKPIVLKEQPDNGSSTLIEKFEKYAPICSFAFAVFTPDDEIENKGTKYLQARPNVIFELGWFFGRLGRNKVLILLQEGTSIFSDLDGILQKRFTNNIVEVYRDLETELKHAGVID